MSSLREELVKLAQENPDLRKHLLPILREAAGMTWEIDPKSKGNVGRDPNLAYKRFLDYKKEIKRLSKKVEKKVEDLEKDLKRKPELIWVTAAEAYEVHQRMLDAAGEAG